MSVLPSFKRLRTEDEKFNAVLSYTVSLAQLGIYNICVKKENGFGDRSDSSVSLQTSGPLKPHEKESRRGCSSL